MPVSTKTAQGPTRVVLRQDERRAAARLKLLLAAEECLAELGWSGTSTTEVARRAGLSRGAQQHHYPTKIELVAATIEHVVDGQQREFRLAFSALAEHERTAAAAIDLTWEIFHSVSSRAAIALVAAARTDPELAPLCADLDHRVSEVCVQTFAEFFPAATHAVTPVVLRALFAMLTGLALPGEHDPQGHRAEVIAAVKTWARAFVPDPPAVTSTAGTPPAGPSRPGAATSAED